MGWTPRLRSTAPPLPRLACSSPVSSARAPASPSSSGGHPRPHARLRGATARRRASAAEMTPSSLLSSRESVRWPGMSLLTDARGSGSTMFAGEERRQVSMPHDPEGNLREPSFLIGSRSTLECHYSKPITPQDSISVNESGYIPTSRLLGVCTTRESLMRSMPDDAMRAHAR